MAIVSSGFSGFVSRIGVGEGPVAPESMRLTRSPVDDMRVEEDGTHEAFHGSPVVKRSSSADAVLAVAGTSPRGDAAPWRTADTVPDIWT